MAHRTRHALTPLALCLFALALPHAFAFAAQTPAQQPAAPLHLREVSQSLTVEYVFGP